MYDMHNNLTCIIMQEKNTEENTKDTKDKYVVPHLCGFARLIQIYNVHRRDMACPCPQLENTKHTKIAKYTKVNLSPAGRHYSPFHLSTVSPFHLST